MLVLSSGETLYLFLSSLADFSFRQSLIQLIVVIPTPRKRKIQYMIIVPARDWRCCNTYVSASALILECDDLSSLWSRRPQLRAAAYEKRRQVVALETSAAPCKFGPK